MRAQGADRAAQRHVILTQRASEGIVADRLGLRGSDPSLARPATSGRTAGWCLRTGRSARGFDGFAVSDSLYVPVSDSFRIVVYNHSQPVGVKLPLAHRTGTVQTRHGMS